MVTCVVACCKNSSSKVSKNKNGITFHRFPRDKSRRKRWMVAVSREEDWAPTTFSAVCSEHFGTHDFCQTGTGNRRLSEAAVPSVNISPSEGQQNIPSSPTNKFTDINPTDSEEVVQLKHTIQRLEILAANRKRRLTLMRRSNNRIKDKLERMQCLVNHLIKYNETVKENET